MNNINDTLSAPMILTNDDLANVQGGCHSRKYYSHSDDYGQRGDSRGGRGGRGGRGRGNRVDVNNDQEINIDVDIDVFQNAQADFG